MVELNGMLNAEAVRLTETIDGLRAQLKRRAEAPPPDEALEAENRALRAQLRDECVRSDSRLVRMHVLKRVLRDERAEATRLRAELGMRCGADVHESRTAALRKEAGDGSRRVREMQRVLAEVRENNRRLMQENDVVRSEFRELAARYEEAVGERAPVRERRLGLAGWGDEVRRPSCGVACGCLLTFETRRIRTTPTPTWMIEGAAFF
jgi:regulator of replication initiation timing